MTFQTSDLGKGVDLTREKAQRVAQALTKAAEVIGGDAERRR